MLNRLKRWRRLSARERWLLLQLSVAMPAFAGALWLFGIRRTYRLIAQSVSATSSDEIPESCITSARHLGSLVDIASRHGPYRASCLPKSLVLCWLLRRRGLPAQLQIGVGRKIGQIQAHAWVELAGQVVNDR